MRPKPLLTLLQSVHSQTSFPNEILIIDGSTNSDTQTILEENPFPNLQYYKVPPQHRGLTKQRNYGIERVGIGMEIVCFLDDDTVLEKDYFQQLLHTYEQYPEALGVGGYIKNEIQWQQTMVEEAHQSDFFYYDGWQRKESSRFRLRKKLGLDSDCPPGYAPLFSHGRSISFLPPSQKTYEVEQLMGGVSSFRKSVFDHIQFATYFQGYGLYEDADFSLRLAKTGKLYLNTAAQLNHYHAPSGRPNQYQYGKMVVRNGYYVWRIKNPKPNLKAKTKWHAITLLLTLIRATNILNTPNRKAAATETLGRIIGWLSIFYQKPI